MSDDKIPIRRTPSMVSTATEPVTQPTYPTDIVELPTKGWFYPEGNPLSSGEIEIKQMTAREEDILANQDLIRKGKVLEKLLQSLLVNKEVNSKEILIPDKNAIFIAIRRFAYGDTYSVNFTCPQCGEKTRIDINLGELKDRPVDIEKFPRGKNEFPFTLPKSQAVVTYKFLNQYDDDEIEKELLGFKKINKESGSEVTTRLKHIITSVNGDEDKAVIRKFVDDMPAADARALREHIKDNTPDVDMRFDFKCSNCELERRTDIPIGASFLWPDLET